MRIGYSSGGALGKSRTWRSRVESRLVVGCAHTRPCTAISQQDSTGFQRFVDSIWLETRKPIQSLDRTVRMLRVCANNHFHASSGGESAPAPRPATVPYSYAVMPCTIVPYSVLPCPAQHSPDLHCSAQPCTALPCPALRVTITFHFLSTESGSLAHVFQVSTPAPLLPRARVAWHGGAWRGITGHANHSVW